ncbi:uncharacterized protein VP01_5447g1, partial [Puccinia sorghi]
LEKSTTLPPRSFEKVTTLQPVVLRPSHLLARSYSIPSPTLNNFPPTPTKWLLLLFMTDDTENWSQPYLMKVFNPEEAFKEFLDDFKSMSAYTQEFNSHACTIGWADSPLMSIYQHRLTDKVQLAVVMSNIHFTFLQTMQAMALKAGHTIEDIWNGQPAPIPPLAPVPQPPTSMQWTSRLSNVLNLGFRCGQGGHVSRGCSNGNRKLQGRQQSLSSARISELQAKINRIFC